MNTNLIEKFSELLDPEISYEEINQRVELGKFPKEWKDLLFLMVILRRDNLEINAVNIMQRGGNIPTTALYMKLIQDRDRMRIG